MKQCPQCHQTYSDDQLNFCLNDGEMLSSYVQATQPGGYADDSPPTMLLDPPRQTDPINWPQDPPSAPPVQWSGQPWNALQGAAPLSPNQTLALVSMGLGIGSMTIGWCCSLGLLLSPAALITGFIALSQIKKDPQANGGRGFAIAGIATGSVFIAIYVLIIVLWGFTALLGGLR